ncbi:MAG: biotin/lipoyl-binding protein, partial [Thermoanaerobaculia bacterium]|nr:biotin/lipoyl-binding protein [Thermoanaerobaculia bacterium]
MRRAPERTSCSVCSPCCSSRRRVRAGGGIATPPPRRCASPPSSKWRAPTARSPPPSSTPRGYVTARRRATVSSKITAKIVEVFVEEGLEVEQGQVLARLDDAIPTRQLALAESQLRATKSALTEIEVRSPKP